MLPGQRLLGFILVIAMPISACAATVIKSPSFEALKTGVNGAQPIRLEFDGKIDFPESILIETQVEIDGRGRSVQMDGRLQNQLFRVGASGSLSLRGLTLQNGLIQPAPGVDGFGGAIHVAGGHLVAESCVFTNNVAKGGIARAVQRPDPNYDLYDLYPGGDSFGGAICVEGGAVTLQGCVLIGNSSVGSETAYGGGHYAEGGAGCGGGLSSSNSVVRITGCRLQENSATGATSNPRLYIPYSWGGGIFADRGEFEIESSQIVSNRAGVGDKFGSGGGISFGRDVPTAGGSETRITNCGFTGNIANGGVSYGGAIFGWRPMRIERCAFKENRSFAQRMPFGGAIALSEGTIHNSVFVENVAEGADFFSTLGGQWIMESRWGVGSAIYIHAPNFEAGGTCRLTHCTFVGNQSRKGTYASPNGWTIGSSVDAKTESRPLGTAIMAANVIVPGEGPSVRANVFDFGFNISADGAANFSEPTSGNNIDPRLEYRPNSFGLYWPSANSPALNRVTTRLLETDVRGAARPLTGSDAGAVEVEGTAAMSIEARTESVVLRAGFADAMEVLGSSDFVRWESAGRMVTVPGGKELEVLIDDSFRFFRGRFE